jgi:peptidoglycan/LPS O-acetylase OafA/YrhL
VKEQAAQSKGNAARRGLEQPSARQPVRHPSEDDSAEASWRDSSECAKASPSETEPAGLRLATETKVKVESPLNASDVDSRASIGTGLRLPAVGPSANPRLPSKHLSHLFELDVVRGLMAWWVVVGHVLAFAGFQENNVPSVIAVVMHGAYAVNIFMMMSGFVIAKLLADKNESYKVFITRRLLRIYPVFFVALAVAILVRPLYMHILLDSRAPLPWHYERIWDAENNHFWPHILAHWSMLYGVIPESTLRYAGIALLGPAWSMTIEFQYYLVAPLLIFTARRFGTKGWITLIVVAGLVSEVFGATLQGNFPTSLPTFLPLFLAGMTSYLIYAKTKEQEAKVPADILLAGAPLLYLVTGSVPATIWAVAMALILANGDSPVVSRMKSLLNRPSLLFLGKISYSTYLIHYPILWLAKALVACVALHANPFVVALALFALTTPATLGASALLYHFVEKPGIDFGRRLFKNPTPVPLGRDTSPLPRPLQLISLNSK